MGGRSDEALAAVAAVVKDWLLFLERRPSLLLLGLVEREAERGASVAEDGSGSKIV